MDIGNGVLTDDQAELPASFFLCSPNHPQDYHPQKRCYPIDSATVSHRGCRARRVGTNNRRWGQLSSCSFFPRPSKIKRIPWTSFRASQSDWRLTSFHDCTFFWRTPKQHFVGLDHASGMNRHREEHRLNLSRQRQQHRCISKPEGATWRAFRIGVAIIPLLFDFIEARPATLLVPGPQILTDPENHAVQEDMKLLCEDRLPRSCQSAVKAAAKLLPSRQRLIYGPQHLRREWASHAYNRVPLK